MENEDLAEIEAILEGTDESKKEDKSTKNNRNNKEMSKSEKRIIENVEYRIKQQLKLFVNLEDGGKGFVFTLSKSSHPIVRYNCHICRQSLDTDNFLEHVNSKDHQKRMTAKVFSTKFKKQKAEPSSGSHKITHVSSHDPRRQKTKDSESPDQEKLRSQRKRLRSRSPPASGLKEDIPPFSPPKKKTIRAEPVPKSVYVQELHLTEKSTTHSAHSCSKSQPSACSKEDTALKKTVRHEPVTKSMKVQKSHQREKFTAQNLCSKPSSGSKKDDALKKTVRGEPEPKSVKPLESRHGDKPTTQPERLRSKTSSSADLTEDKALKKTIRMELAPKIMKIQESHQREKSTTLCSKLRGEFSGSKEDDALKKNVRAEPVPPSVKLQESHQRKKSTTQPERLCSKPSPSSGLKEDKDLKKTARSEAALKSMTVQESNQRQKTTTQPEQKCSKPTGLKEDKALKKTVRMGHAPKSAEFQESRQRENPLTHRKRLCSEPSLSAGLKEDNPLKKSIRVEISPKSKKPQGLRQGEKPETQRKRLCSEPSSSAGLKEDTLVKKPVLVKPVPNSEKPQESRQKENFATQRKRVYSKPSHSAGVKENNLLEDNKLAEPIQPSMKLQEGEIPATQSKRLCSKSPPSADSKEVRAKPTSPRDQKSRHREKPTHPTCPRTKSVWAVSLEDKVISDDPPKELVSISNALSLTYCSSTRRRFLSHSRFLPLRRPAYLNSNSSNTMGKRNEKDTTVSYSAEHNTGVDSALRKLVSEMEKIEEDSETSVAGVFNLLSQLESQLGNYGLQIKCLAEEINRSSESDYSLILGKEKNTCLLHAVKWHLKGQLCLIKNSISAIESLSLDSEGNGVTKVPRPALASPRASFASTTVSVLHQLSLLGDILGDCAPQIKRLADANQSNDAILGNERNVCLLHNVKWNLKGQLCLIRNCISAMDSILLETEEMKNNPKGSTVSQPSAAVPAVGTDHHKIPNSKVVAHQTTEKELASSVPNVTPSLRKNNSDPRLRRSPKHNVIDREEINNVNTSSNVASEKGELSVKTPLEQMVAAQQNELAVVKPLLASAFQVIPGLVDLLNTLVTKPKAQVNAVQPAPRVIKPPFSVQTTAPSNKSIPAPDVTLPMQSFPSLLPPSVVSPTKTPISFVQKPVPSTPLMQLSSSSAASSLLPPSVVSPTKTPISYVQKPVFSLNPVSSTLPMQSSSSSVASSLQPPSASPSVVSPTKTVQKPVSSASEIEPARVVASSIEEATFSALHSCAASTIEAATFSALHSRAPPVHSSTSVLDSCYNIATTIHLGLIPPASALPQQSVKSECSTYKGTAGYDADNTGRSYQDFTAHTSAFGVTHTVQSDQSNQDQTLQIPRAVYSKVRIPEKTTDSYLPQ